MSKPYSQTRAFWAITRASFKAIQPISIVFSLLFPIIFILIFGAFGEGGAPTYRIAFEPGSDSTGFVYNTLKKHDQIRISSYPDTAKMNDDLRRGRLTAVVNVHRIDSFRYSIGTRYTSASANTFGGLTHVLDYIRLNYDLVMGGNKTEYVTIEEPQKSEAQQYRQIDFVLPGQLGFSILFSTLFGIAFTFFSLREQLVLKRFYASPVRRINILVGIGTSRLFFQLMNVVVLILFGHFFMNFTLRHGAWTAIEMILMSIFMLFFLMGVGLIFSCVVKGDTMIPLLVNLFGFPQMMLSGTFFPIEVFPKWLQTICNILPLTQFNNAIRKISFEGLSLLDCGKELGILSIWMVVTYVICVRVMKWE
jgi:ABC-2 type transport system permease protein